MALLCQFPVRNTFIDFPPPRQSTRESLTKWADYGDDELQDFPPPARSNTMPLARVVAQPQTLVSTVKGTVQEVTWFVDARKLQSSDKQIVSPTISVNFMDWELYLLEGRAQ